MKYCNKCGSAISDDSNFCSKCGTKFTDEQAANNKIPKDTPVIIWIIIGLLFPIIGAILYYSDVFRFHQKEYYHKAYFGLYLAWWNSCKYNNKWDTFIDKFFKNAILNAPLDIQEEYHKIYNKNNKIFHKEDL